MNTKILFWDVDTQHDFMDPSGKLPVPGADEIVANLRRLTEFAVSHEIPIVASVDAHSEDDDEFKRFPPHCVAGTPGQKKISGTTAQDVQVADARRPKEQIAALSAGRIRQLIIEKRKLDVFSEPAADEILYGLAPEKVMVYGVTTEHCVYETVKGLAEREFKTYVVNDAIRAVDKKAGREAIRQMRRLGAHFILTNTALEEPR
jgi:nicotinamidase/pyrazinamidase